MAPCWNGHREACTTSAQDAYNNGIMYTNNIIYVYAVWMGGAGGGVWGWVANGYQG